MNFLRSFLILIFVLLSQTVVFAHEDTYISKQEGNLYMNFRTSSETFEFKTKCDIFFRLASELVAKMNPKEKVFIQIYPYGNYLEIDRTSALGFGDFEFFEVESRRLISKQRHNGLILIVNLEDFDIQKTLQLLACGVKNSSEVKKLQKQRFVDLHETMNGKKQFDTLLSVPKAKIVFFENLRSNLTDNLIQKKSYRTSSGANSENVLDYYYQNNAFHIYNSSYPETKYNPQTGVEDTVRTFGEDLFTLSDITEIRYTRAGEFVFLNDSVFYFFPDELKKFSGPYHLKNIAVDRPAVRELIYEYAENGKTKVYLVFDNFITTTKALFLPDQRRLINDYQLLEDRLISGRTTVSERKRESYLMAILLPLLIVSLGFNVLRLIRK